MSALTAKQDHFARLVVINGLDQTHAYRKAYDASGMSGLATRVEASRVAANQKVRARMEELRTLCDEKTEVTVKRIARELARIAFFDPLELFDPETGAARPFDELPEDLRRAIGNVEITELKGGMKITVPGGKTDDGVKAAPVQWIPMRNKSISMHPKMAALQVLAKWKRMLVERVESGAPGDFDHLSDEELEKEIEAEREALKVIEQSRARASRVVEKKATKGKVRARSSSA